MSKDTAAAATKTAARGLAGAPVCASGASRVTPTSVGTARGGTDAAFAM